MLEQLEYRIKRATPLEFFSGNRASQAGYVVLASLLALPIGKRLCMCAGFDLEIKILLTHWQCENDKCLKNERFRMDVIFHVWVDVTINTLRFPRYPKIVVGEMQLPLARVNQPYDSTSWPFCP
jgi:hypothetical protein